MRTTYDRRMDGIEVWVRNREPKPKRMSKLDRKLERIDRELDRIEAAIAAIESRACGASGRGEARARHSSPIADNPLSRGFA